MNTLIVIPTYEEKENIGDLLDKIFEILSNYNISVLVVDDSISNDTSDIVELKKKMYNNLYLIRRKTKQGLAKAYIDGFKYGIEKGFDSFIEMDADFSHNPNYLPKVIELLKDNDVVIASRNIKGGSVEGWSWIRTLISKGGSIYSKIILNCSINDLTGGFNAWRKETLDKIGLDNIISKGYSFQIEMKYKAFKNKAKIIEFPIVFLDRKFGKSKMSKTIFFEALLNVIRIRLFSKI